MTQVQDVKEEVPNISPPPEDEDYVYILRAANPDVDYDDRPIEYYGEMEDSSMRYFSSMSSAVAYNTKVLREAIEFSKTRGKWPDALRAMTANDESNQYMKEEDFEKHENPTLLEGWFNWAKKKCRIKDVDKIVAKVEADLFCDGIFEHEKRKTYIPFPWTVRIVELPRPIE